MADPEADRGSDALALIPARAGSKGLPGKNLRKVGGVSLLARTIAVAQAVDGVARVVVSTDGEDIAEEAVGLGAEVHVRPPELATDSSPVIDTIRDVLACSRERGTSPRYALLLEPTSPLRSVADVQGCLDAVVAGADSAATFTEAALHPHRAFVIEDGVARTFIDAAVPWQPRQALTPRAFQLSGNAYAFRCADVPPEGLSVLFGNSAAIVVPRERSIDIDDATDLQVVEALLAMRA